MAQKYDSRTMNRGDADWRETKRRQASAKKWADELNKINSEKMSNLKPIAPKNPAVDKNKLKSIQPLNAKVDKKTLTSIKPKTSTAKKTATKRTLKPLETKKK